VIHIQAWPFDEVLTSKFRKAAKNWLEADRNTYSMLTESAQDDIDAGLWILRAAALTMRLNHVLRDLIDCPVLRRILNGKVTPDDVRINICRLVTTLLLPEYGFWRRTNDFTVRAKVLSANLVPPIVQLLM
jgi:hypothetical protein